MNALVRKRLRLERFPGKGGWTFIKIARSVFEKKKFRGKVRGTIDGYEIRKFHLMPMGKEFYMLPVKAEIRKHIGKTEGDLVAIVLFPDHEPLKTPKEMLHCLADEPAALTFYKSLSESERNFYIKWIYSAKRDETKVERMAKSVTRLARGLKLYQPEV